MEVPIIGSDDNPPTPPQADPPATGSATDVEERETNSEADALELGPEPVAALRPLPPTRIQVRRSLQILVLAVAVGSLYLRLLIDSGLQQSAALYVGLPTFVALLALSNLRYSSATGLALWAVTVLLLLALIVFGEGWICILMAAPIFYACAVSVGVIVDHQRRRLDREWLLLPLVLLSLEGTHPALSRPRQETISVERLVSASPAEIERSLGSPPDFDRPLPGMLAWGFPRPVASAGAGLSLGTQRSFGFEVGAASPAWIEARVIERQPERAVLAIESDHTPMADWLDLERSIVEWSALPEGGSRIRWTLEYDRELDPAWYFGPLQRHGVRLAAGHLIEAFASEIEE